jgi:hypothetical protein
MWSFGIGSNKFAARNMEMQKISKVMKTKTTSLLYGLLRVILVGWNFFKKWHQFFKERRWSKKQ